MRVLIFLLVITISAFGQDEWFNIGPTGYDLEHIYDLEVLNADTILFTSGNKQLFITENGGADWEVREVELVASGHIRKDSHGNLYIAGLQAVVKSTDLGISWTRIDATIPGLEYGLYIYNDTLYVANETNLFYSTDYGASWITTNFNHAWGSVQRNSEYLFATYFAMGNCGLSRSSDNGTTWNPVSMSFGVATFCVSEENEILLYSNSENIGLFYSADNGDNWMHSEHFQSENNYINSIHRTTNERYFIKVAGETQTGLYTSTNPVTGWKYIGLGDKENYPVTVDAETEIVYVGLSGEGVFYHAGPYTPVELSSFNGVVAGTSVILNWQTTTETNNKGFEVERKTGGAWKKIGFIEGHGTVTDPHDYSFTDTYPDEGANYYRLKQTDYDGECEYSKQIKIEFVSSAGYKLEQNYPNPFNPTTTILFTLKEECNVKLKIYDTNGQLIEKLTEQMYSAGRHQINFNGENLSSGIYFYRIEVLSRENTPLFFDMGKMVIIK